MLTKAHKLRIKRLIDLEEEPGATEIYDFFTGEGDIYQYLININYLTEMVKAEDKLLRKASSLEIRRFIVNEMYNASIAHSYSQSLRQARRNFLRKVYPVKQHMDASFFKELRPFLKASVSLPHNLNDFSEQSHALKVYENETRQISTKNIKKTANTAKQHQRHSKPSKN
jgi:hypothetical protein